MSRLELTAVNRHGKVIKSGCAISITYQEIYFNGHSIQYKQTKKGNYFILDGVRYYFKVYDNFYKKWIIGCNCF